MAVDLEEPQKYQLSEAFLFLVGGWFEVGNSKFKVNISCFFFPHSSLNLINIAQQLLGYERFHLH